MDVFDSFLSANGCSETNSERRLCNWGLLCLRPGMFEAGTFPAIWAHLTKFYAGGPDLAAAWGFIGAAQPLAQVGLSTDPHRWKLSIG